MGMEHKPSLEVDDEGADQRVSVVSQWWSRSDAGRSELAFDRGKVAQIVDPSHMWVSWQSPFLGSTNRLWAVMA